MSVPQFPTSFIYHSVHPSEPSGPHPNVFQRLPAEYPGVVMKQMVDGGKVYGADTTNKIMRWKLVYNGLSTTDAATLDTHHTAALDTFLPFQFRDWRADVDVLYSDVHYESYEYPQHADQDGLNIQTRIVTLIKSPA